MTGLPALLRLTAILVPLLAPGARAHSELRASEPAEGAVVAAPPDRIVLRFTAPMQVTSLRLLDAAGRERAIRREGARAAAVEELRAAIVAPLPPGLYRVEYRGLSADGHVGSGAVEFRFQPARP
jgi:methionine-rich copper-binding protein CopC